MTEPKNWDQRVRDQGEYRQAYSRIGQLRLSLDVLEAKHGMTSAMAMNRITSGRFAHPGWASIMTEYLALVREPEIPWPPWMPTSDSRSQPARTELPPAPPSIPVDSADAREKAAMA